MKRERESEAPAYLEQFYPERFACARCDKAQPQTLGRLDDTPALCDSCAVYIQDLWTGAFVGGST